MKKHFYSILALSSVFALGAASDAFCAGENLAGKWNQEKCQTDMIKKLFNRGSSRTNFDFKDGAVSKIEQFYNSGDCQTPEALVTYGGGYQVVAENPAGIFHLNTDLKSVSITPQTQNITDQFNRETKCGRNDWKLNEARDVTARGKANSCDLDQVPSAAFDIYHVEGNTLLFGDEKGKDKSSAEQRPTKVGNDKWIKA